MNLDDAKKVLKDEQDAPFGRLVMAAGILCASENAQFVSLEELIDCLKRGKSSVWLTLVSEYAALALYARTARKRRECHGPYEDFITDPADWLGYLNENGFKLCQDGVPNQ